jgi:uncharacterized protein YegL
MDRDLKELIPCLLRTIALLLALGTPLRTIQAGQNVIVVLDDSGSMRKQMRTDDGRISRIQAAKNALSKVISGLPSDAQLGILLLNNSGQGNTWLTPLGPLSAASVLPKIAKIRADGGTPLGSQMKIAADALLSLRQKQIYGDYRLLVVTDGEATDANLLEAYLPDILSRGISLDVIGVDMVANHSLADRAHSYRRADDAQSFERALAEIFAESSNQTDDQGTSDFEMIAGLPDELAKQSLAALATPRNDNISLAKAPILVSPNHAPSPSQSVPTTASNPSLPPHTAPPPASSITSFFGFLATLPIFLTIIFFFIVMVLLTKKKR